MTFTSCQVAQPSILLKGPMLVPAQMVVAACAKDAQVSKQETIIDVRNLRDIARRLLHNLLNGDIDVRRARDFPFWLSVAGEHITCRQLLILRIAGFRLRFPSGPSSWSD